MSIYLAGDAGDGWYYNMQLAGAAGDSWGQYGAISISCYPEGVSWKGVTKLGKRESSCIKGMV